MLFANPLFLLSSIFIFSFLLLHPPLLPSSGFGLYSSPTMSSLKEKDLESSALQDQDAARPTLAHNNLKGPSLQDDPQTAPYPTFSGDIPWSQRSWLYELTPFRGMYYDLKRRLPFYKDDWLDALHPENWYKITESTIRMYFIK